MARNEIEYFLSEECVVSSDSFLAGGGGGRENIMQCVVSTFGLNLGLEV